MKTMVRFLGISPGETGPELYQKLCEIYPAGRKEGSFWFTLPEEDARTRALLDCLERYGFHPCKGLDYKQPHEFLMDLDRVYDAQELAQASYLVPWPQVSFGPNVYRTEAGVLELEVDGVVPNAGIAVGGGRWLIVSDTIKRRMEQADLRHVLFRETVLDKPDRAPRKPFWELTSDLILPPLSPPCVLINDFGQSFDGDYDKGCLLREGLFVPEVLYKPQQLHYAADALEPLPAFDLALTHEQFGRKTRLLRQRVASAQLYAFCIANHLKIDWRPVHIIPR